MALYTIKSGQNIPPGGVKVSKEEALSLQKALVRDWKKHSDVIFLRYSGHMASALITLTTVPIWNSYRKVFDLGRRGIVSMFLPGTLLPVICTMMNFDKYVTNEVLLMKNACPLCYQIPLGLVQIHNGVIQPVIVGISLGMVFCTTPPKLPNIKVEPKNYFKAVFKNYVLPGTVKFQFCAALHILSIAFFPYMQTKELLNIMAEVNKMNEQKNHKLK